MPEPDTHTPVRRIRIPDRLWSEFGKAAGHRMRSAILIEFMRWYVSEPKARLPKRPDPPTPGQP